MRLLVQNVRTAARAGRCDLRIRGRRLIEVGRGLRLRRFERAVDGRGYFALPGLINAHDHLSLNLLPHLGTPPYPNLYAFARDNYRPDASPQRELMHQTRVADRLWWGAYKNLISGVTTVAHHDPFTRRIFHRWFPVKVVRRYGWSHSLGYDADPAPAFHASRGPFIIHAAEGIDEVSGTEIDRLDALGLLSARTVLIHAIEVSNRQRARLAATGTGVVWCPYSNLRLYGRTAHVEALAAAGIAVALGTDSTMSGAPTLLDEARTAVQTGRATPAQVLAMVTEVPAELFQLGDGRGGLTPGAPADLLLLPARGDAAATLLAARPADVALVLVDGRPRLAAAPLAEALGLGPPNAWVAGAAKWLYGDLAALRRRLLRDAGAKALAGNPLWTLLRASPDA